MHTNLIILAGGVSSRMKKEANLSSLSKDEIEQANSRSKGLIGVGSSGRPLLDYLLLNAKNAGYKHIYIVTGENDLMFRKFYGVEIKANDFHGLKISYAVQYIPKNRVKPYGTADALLQTLEQYPHLIKQTFTVCNSDNLYSKEAFESLRTTESSNAFISYDRDALDFVQERISRFALAKLDNENKLIAIVEKPPLNIIESFRDAMGKLRVSMNIFKFSGELIYPYLKECPVNPERNEKEIPTALANMLKDYPDTMKGISLSEHVPDLTAKEDIATVKQFLKTHYAKLVWN